MRTSEEIRNSNVRNKRRVINDTYLYESDGSIQIYYMLNGIYYIYMHYYLTVQDCIDTIRADVDYQRHFEICHNITNLDLSKMVKLKNEYPEEWL